MPVVPVTHGGTQFVSRPRSCVGFLIQRHIQGNLLTAFQRVKK